MEVSDRALTAGPSPSPDRRVNPLQQEVQLIIFGRVTDAGHDEPGLPAL